MLSYPKGKWTVTVDLYDDQWRNTATAKATLENSGIIMGRPGIISGELRVLLGPRADFARAKRFCVCIRPADQNETADAEIKQGD